MGEIVHHIREWEYLENARIYRLAATIHGFRVANPDEGVDFPDSPEDPFGDTGSVWDWLNWDEVESDEDGIASLYSFVWRLDRG